MKKRTFSLKSRSCNATSIELIHGSFLEDQTLPKGSIDLIIADPPYGLGKDYGNDSDKRFGEAFLQWTFTWLEKALPFLKKNGTLYIFCTWKYSPEIFSFLKQHLIMINEIIWDRRMPSMGGSVRKFSSVHDNIGVFVASASYYFDLDAVRMLYDEATKKERTRKQFVGSKWLEQGCNPKDVWSIARLHRQHTERVAHPTQKPLALIERMILASCPAGGRVLDPFMGSGTTAVVCAQHHRAFIGFEVNQDYWQIACDRLVTVNQIKKSV